MKNGVKTVKKFKEVVKEQYKKYDPVVLDVACWRTGKKRIMKLVLLYLPIGENLVVGPASEIMKKHSDALVLWHNANCFLYSPWLYPYVTRADVCIWEKFIHFYLLKDGKAYFSGGKKPEDMTAKVKGGKVGVWYDVEGQEDYYTNPDSVLRLLGSWPKLAKK